MPGRKGLYIEDTLLDSGRFRVLQAGRQNSRSVPHSDIGLSTFPHVIDETNRRAAGRVGVYIRLIAGCRGSGGWAADPQSGHRIGSNQSGGAPKSNWAELVKVLSQLLAVAATWTVPAEPATKLPKFQLTICSVTDGLPVAVT